MKYLSKNTLSAKIIQFDRSKNIVIEASGIKPATA